MNGIIRKIKEEKEYSKLVENALSQRLAKNSHPILVTGLSDGAAVSFYVSLAEDIKEKTDRGILIIVPEEKTGVRIKSAFESCGKVCLSYPYRDYTLHNITGSHEYEYERLNVLTALNENTFDAILCTPDAALQYTVPQDVLEQNHFDININEEYEIDSLVKYLTDNGYTRADMVDGIGQFSVRGGIIDIFSPASSLPVRVDFFDTEIEQMGTFDIITQRRIESVDSYKLIPAREVFFGKEKRTELENLISSELAKAEKNTPIAVDTLKSELEALKAGTDIKFADKYISLIYPEKECLLDYFKDGFCVINEYTAIKDRLKSYEFQNDESAKELIDCGEISGKYADFGKRASELDYRIDTGLCVISEPFLTTMGNKKLSGIYSFQTRNTVSYFDNYKLLCEDLSGYVSSKYKIAVLTESEQKAETLMRMLGDSSFAAVMTKDLPENMAPGAVYVIYGPVLHGFELPGAKFVCLSLFANSGILSRGSYRKKNKLSNKKSAKEKIMSYADLTPGDYVVHTVHGIGQYIGLHTLTVGGITEDFVKIQYAGKDILYLPCTQLDSIAKYIGAKGQDGTLRLSKMGGTEWVKAKLKVKNAAKDMAKELISLYAERIRKKGIAFEKDDAMQSDFEADFEYEETEGQLAAVADIKHDMEEPYPMDRLLCGDVGFGKTEVALRAAFKAVNSSKQVAFVVPTTILALQHYQTITSRMRGFPVKVEMLSRFSTPKQQAETVRKLRRSECDIVVGTHRLFSKDIEFKNLGLVVIDEEQRFGVAHKEKLKQLTKNVDVLTLTATPIPRTLNMAMSGIRDMSVLEEAPGDRLPVQSYVLEYDELIIAEAIKKELRRGGQVFYLHNNIDSIDYAANRVASMVPDARIAVAHGKMDKEQLSDLWKSLCMGEIDIFISTTIIESGVDVPNANTLIIENADKLGLSQLHQIRGRVGRSSRRAYAYFTYPKGKVLSEDAEKRLTAIRDFTEFGAGFKVALRDLEIRGAGNILGAEQHGHMQNVGYDRYMKLLNEAILEEKGEKIIPKKECAVSLNINAYIPDKYIFVPSQRIDVYKKIALIENEEDVMDVTDELLDRYGDIPEETMNLLNISLVRRLGSENCISKVERNNGSILFYPFKMDAALWTELASENRGKVLLNLSANPYISYKLDKKEDMFAAIKMIFKCYSEIVNKSQM